MSGQGRSWWWQKRFRMSIPTLKTTDSTCKPTINPFCSWKECQTNDQIAAEQTKQERMSQILGNQTKKDCISLRTNSPYIMQLAYILENLRKMILTPRLQK